MDLKLDVGSEFTMVGRPQELARFGQHKGPIAILVGGVTVAQAVSTGMVPGPRPSQTAVGFKLEAVQTAAPTVEELSAEQLADLLGTTEHARLVRALELRGIKLAPEPEAG